MSDSRIIAIIPARGNSKRIEGKNTRVLGDKPLIHYTLQQACESSLITEVIVSSESAQVLECVTEWTKANMQHFHKLYVHQRSRHLSLDHVQVSEVMLNTLRMIEVEQYGGNIIPDNIHLVSLAPTSPFRTAEMIDHVISRHLRENPKGTTLTAAKNNGYFWQDGHPVNHDPSRRYGWQDNEKEFSPTLKENGSVYVVNAHKFSLETVMRFAPYLIVADEDTIDLDTPDDWSHAEARRAIELVKEKMV